MQKMEVLLAVLLIAGFYIFMAFSTPSLDRGVWALGYALSVLIAWAFPVYQKFRHVRSQNRLLDRCRAYLLTGLNAVAADDRMTAERLLVRICRIERLWRIGNSIIFRMALTTWAIGLGIAACVMTRFAGYITHRHLIGEALDLNLVATELRIAIVTSMLAPLYAAVAFFEPWVNPWAIENCGDRLWQALHGPRGMTVPPTRPDPNVPRFDGMTAREILGLGSVFSRRELDRARRKLVFELHPDRWHNAHPLERQAREEALKRVNAAYDMLRRRAG